MCQLTIVLKLETYEKNVNCWERKRETSARQKTYVKRKDIITCSGSWVCGTSILSSLLDADWLWEGGTLWMTETRVGGSTLGVFGGVLGLGNTNFSDFVRNCVASLEEGAIGGLLYSLRSALVKTWPLLPYGISPPRILEINRLGGVLVGVFVDCHWGGGDEAGLLLRSDSGVVARSSSVFSRSINRIIIITCYNLPVYRISDMFSCNFQSFLFLSCSCLSSFLILNLEKIVTFSWLFIKKNVSIQNKIINVKLIYPVNGLLFDIVWDNKQDNKSKVSLFKNLLS